MARVQRPVKQLCDKRSKKVDDLFKDVCRQWVSRGAFVGKFVDRTDDVVDAESTVCNLEVT